MTQAEIDTLTKLICMLKPEDQRGILEIARDHIKIVDNNAEF